MANRNTILLAGLLAAGAAPVAAAESKPVYQWVSANEYYFILPVAQDLHLTGNGNAESVKPWSFGFRAVGHETFSKTGGLQVQSIKVDNPSTGKDTFYLWELLAGMQYTSPKVQGKPLRFTEVDYILKLSGEVFAIEVKSGRTKETHSGLSAFLSRNREATGIVISNTRRVKSQKSLSLEDFFQAPERVMEKM